MIDQSLNVVTGLLVMLSSTGLWGLTINARYLHTATLIKSTFDRGSTKEELKPLVIRGQLLKWSLASIILSAMISSFYIMAQVLQFNTEHLLIINLSCIILAMFLFFIDVLLSMKSTLIHIDRRQS